MLCGLVRPSADTRTIAGAWMFGSNGRRSRAKFGYVAQRFSLYRDLTVEENIRFFAGACRVPRERTAGTSHSPARA